MTTRESPRRILFLDVDGVLHPARVPGSPGPSTAYMQVGPLGWLQGLAELLAPYQDVGVVVHSSWRITYSAEVLSEMLYELGERYFDVTPPGERYESILEWLRRHPGTSYLILDDDAAEFPQPPPRELLTCDSQLGVSSEGVRDALRQWLNHQG